MSKREELRNKRINRLKKRKRGRFVYYAVKHPDIFLIVYRESGMRDEEFCTLYNLDSIVLRRVKMMALREKQKNEYKSFKKRGKK